MLNLGDITFGLNADTKGLRKAISRLEDFQKHVDKVTRAQDAGSQKAVRAYAAQERAIRKAIQATARQVAELKRFGAAPEQIARTTNSLRGLQRVMQSGTLNAVQFNRAQDRFGASVARTGRAINKLKFASATRRGSRFNEVIRDLESASVLAVGPLSGLGARIRALGAITSRSTLVIAGFLAGIAAAVIAVVKLAGAALTARKTMDKMEAGFVAATGSIFAAKQEMAFAIEVSRRLGLNLAAVGQEYSKLAAATRGTSLEGEQTRRIFEGVAVATTAMQLSAEQTTGVFRALQQMISKGRVQAEELRGQFGERIPGGFKLAAVAMGVTTKALNKMLEAGEVVAEDLLPKLSDLLINRFGTAAERAASKVIALEQGLSTAFLQVANAIDKAVGVSDTYASVLRGLASTLDFIRINLNNLIAGFVASNAAAIVLFASTSFGAVLFSKLGTAILTAARALISFRIASIATMASGLGPILVAGAAFIGMFIAMKGVLSDTGKQEAEFNEIMAEAKDIIDLTTKSVEQLMSARTNAAITSLETKIIGLTAQFMTADDEVERLNTEIDRLSDIPGMDEGVSAMLQPLKEATNTTAELEAKIQIATDALADLLAIADKKPAALEELSKDAQRAIDKINELQREYLNLQQVQSLLSEGGDERGLRSLEAFQEAAEMLLKVPAGEKVAILQLLQDIAPSAGSAEQAVGILIERMGLLDDVVDKAKKSLTDAPIAIADAEEALRRLRLEIAATTAGPESLQAFNDAMDRQDAIQKFTDMLRKAGVNQEQLNEFVREFIRLMEGLDVAKEKYDALAEAVKTSQETVGRMVDHVGSALVRMFVEGSDAAIDWGNIVMRILGEVFQMMLEMALLNPLKDLFGGVFSGIISTGAGVSPTPGATTGTPFAKGGAFMGGVQMAAKGMVLNGPTAFGGAGGRTVIGGEAGPEGLLPLETMSGGKLGVNATGAKPVTINIINNSGAEVSVQQREGAGGAVDIDILLDRAVAKVIRRGGDSFNTIGQLFNTTPRLAGR